MHPYEAAMSGVYARNFMSHSLRIKGNRNEPRETTLGFLVWLARHQSVLKVSEAIFQTATVSATQGSAKPVGKDAARILLRVLPGDAATSRFGRHFEDEDSNPKLKPSSAKKALRQWLLAPALALPVQKSPLQKRLDAISEALGLDAVSAKILGLMMRLQTNNMLHELIGGEVEADWSEYASLSDRRDLKWTEIGGIIGVSARAVLEAKARYSPLRRFGLTSGCSRDCELEEPILRLLQQRDRPARVSLLASLMGRKCRASDATTQWSDFAHVGPARDVALNLLKGALAAQAKGIVILLHGPPGTGKTAFAQTLIAQAGAKGWMVGESDEDGDETGRSGRLSSLLLASALSKNSKDNVMVLDEADDVFNDGSAGFMSLIAPSKSRDGSKIFMNRALEELGAPTILIANDADNLGEAILRRMSLIIEIKTPSAQLAAKIAGRVLARQKVKVSAETLTALAQNGTPPAVMALAARAARLSGGGSGDLMLAARSVTRMLAIKHKPTSGDLAGMGFDPTFANADMDLARLADQAVTAKTKALSFCLYGAPGTGKSAFARWIAARMGLEVIEKRGSDLFGMYVGETEKNIAHAFEEAADRDAFLIFDEADSLLSDRTGAQRSWEVSQVNEMLTWMERHPLPFAATTNLMKGLDPAALRRFLFKAEFKPLLPDQTAALFERTFNQPAPQALRHLNLLTPGDFAVVARKAGVLGENCAGYLLEALQGEVALKPGAGRVKVGF